jgi:prepilin-type N-terminal cleavage/methylation domain-containing protein
MNPKQIVLGQGFTPNSSVIARSVATKQSQARRLLRFARNDARNYCAFTLVEILIVVAIIAILALAIIPN